MSDTSDLMLLRRYRAMSPIPDPQADTDALQKKVDDACAMPGLEALNLKAPSRRPGEGESAYAERLATFCADASGDPERKAWDPSKYSGPALANVNRRQH